MTLVFVGAVHKSLVGPCVRVAQIALRVSSLPVASASAGFIRKSSIWVLGPILAPYSPSFLSMLVSGDHLSVILVYMLNY
jgi:hypothetical protein